MHNVNVMRGEKTVLKDFSLSIKSGEHVAVLGPNGCGKSTLIKTITRECYPVARPGSSIAIFGQTRWNVFDLRSLLGIVSNDLLAMCTGEAVGRDVVLSGFFSSNDLYSNHRISPEQWMLAEAALERLEVPHLAERPVQEMSSGEAKRVLVARALVHGPKALLFDEPSNSLDIHARTYLRQTVSSLARQGVGIILVTHDVSDIVPEIDRIVLMQNGRIVADGSKETVLTAERLAPVFGVAVEISRREGLYHIW